MTVYDIDYNEIKHRYLKKRRLFSNIRRHIIGVETHSHPWYTVYASVFSYASVDDAKIQYHQVWFLFIINMRTNFIERYV
jgi:hypothetical protein